MIIRDHRLTKLSADKPHTMENRISSDELVPSPQSVSVAMDAETHDPTIVILGVTRSDIQPAAAFPGTEAAAVKRHTDYLPFMMAIKVAPLGLVA